MWERCDRLHARCDAVLRATAGDWSGSERSEDGGFAMTLGEGWQVHVVPVEDRRRHAPDMGCWCGPRIEDGDIVVHAAADRREFVERRRTKPQLWDGNGLPLRGGNG